MSEDGFIRLLNKGALPHGEDPLDAFDLSKGQDSEAEAKKAILDEFRKLLGPLVHELLRDEKGALDSSRIKAEGFEEFKDFLFNEAARDDQKLYRSPYRGLLEDEKYQPLLKLLYNQFDPDSGQYLLFSEGRFRELLRDFQGELLEIDAEAFARQYASTKKGRSRLSSLLTQQGALSKDQKCDLIKALLKVGEEQKVLSENDEEAVTDYLSSWNYFNIAVSDSELEDAAYGARDILRETGWAYRDAESRQANLIKNPHYATFPDAKGKDTPIDPKKIARYQQMVQAGQTSINGVLQAKGHLAKLWLMAADERNWRGQEFEVETWKIRRHILVKCESLISGVKNIEDQANFDWFQKQVQRFVKTRYALGDDLETLLETMPAPTRAPFDDLVRVSDTWKYSSKMDQEVVLGDWEIKAKDKKLKGQIQDLMRGLEKTKHGLWYGYKQHKAISRLGSQVAGLFHRGDIPDIQAATVEINSFLYRLSEARDKGDVTTVIDDLFASLKEGGTLDKALKAAEMEGTEQFLGLVQTIAICVAIAYATRGVGLLPEIGGALARILGYTKGVRDGAALAGEAATIARAGQVVQQASRLERMAKGFELGIQITTAENAIAVVSDEVRPGPEKLSNWAKDGVATGLAMGFISLFLPGAGQVAEESFIKNLYLRYASGGWRGAKHVAMDTGLEVVEENLEQYGRKAMDRDFSAPTKAELTDTTLTVLAGGGLQVGALGEYIKAAKQAPVIQSSESRQGETITPGPEGVKNVSDVEPANDNWITIARTMLTGLTTLVLGMAVKKGDQQKSRKSMTLKDLQSPQSNKPISEPQTTRTKEKILPLVGQQRIPLGLSSMGAGLATFFSSETLYAAVEVAESTGIGTLPVALSGLLVLGIFSRMARWYKEGHNPSRAMEKASTKAAKQRAREFEKFAKKNKLNFSLFLAHALQDASPEVVEASLDRLFSEHYSYYYVGGFEAYSFDIDKTRQAKVNWILTHNIRGGLPYLRKYFVKKKKSLDSFLSKIADCKRLKPKKVLAILRKPTMDQGQLLNDLLQITEILLEWGSFEDTLPFVRQIARDFGNVVSVAVGNEFGFNDLINQFQWAYRKATWANRILIEAGYVKEAIANLHKLSDFEGVMPKHFEKYLATSLILKHGSEADKARHVEALKGKAENGDAKAALFLLDGGHQEAVHYFLEGRVKVEDLFEKENEIFYSALFEFGDRKAAIDFARKRLGEDMNFIAEAVRKNKVSELIPDFEAFLNKPHKSPFSREVLLPLTVLAELGEKEAVEEFFNRYHYELLNFFSDIIGKRYLFADSTWVLSLIEKLENPTIILKYADMLQEKNFEYLYNREILVTNACNSDILLTIAEALLRIGYRDRARLFLKRVLEFPGFTSQKWTQKILALKQELDSEWDGARLRAKPDQKSHSPNNYRTASPLSFHEAKDGNIYRIYQEGEEPLNATTDESGAYYRVSAFLIEESESEETRYLGVVPIQSKVTPKRVLIGLKPFENGSTKRGDQTILFSMSVEEAVDLGFIERTEEGGILKPIHDHKVFVERQRPSPVPMLGESSTIENQSNAGQVHPNAIQPLSDKKKRSRQTPNTGKLRIEVEEIPLNEEDALAIAEAEALAEAEAEEKAQRKSKTNKR